MQTSTSQSQPTSPMLRRRFQTPTPHIYTASPTPVSWAPLSKPSAAATAPLAHGTLLRIISWNIDFSIPLHGDRTTCALDYLASLFGGNRTTAADWAAESEAPMIIMLQEMTAESMTAILAHPWVREKFAVSDKTPLPQRYFTLLLVDRRLSTGEWFRVKYDGSEYGRDVLGVDVLVADSGVGERGDGDVANGVQEGRRAKCLRFCTTHLESLAEKPGFELRPKQLALISTLLKERAQNVEIVGGLVGGDMNAISELDDEIHKRPNVDLRDIWEDNIQFHTPARTESAEVIPDEKDPTLGNAEGHTWGYHPRARFPPKRFDKFFCTGDLEIVALDEVKYSSGKVGRLGVNVKSEKGMWISDHFGIAVGVKVV